jgi:hypothetical protein
MHCLYFCAAASACPLPDPVPPIKTRAHIGAVLDGLGFESGAELGVWNGDFAYGVLSAWRSCKSYTLVDVWKHQENYSDVVNRPDADQETSYKTAMRRLAPHRQKLVVCRNYTSHCAADARDNSLDFIYVDARHDRKGVTHDLHSWWPKLRCGGIFAGHDYVSQTEGPSRMGQDWTLNGDGTRDASGLVVKGAVNDFARRVRRQVMITYQERNFPTWVMRK